MPDCHCCQNASEENQADGANASASEREDNLGPRIRTRRNENTFKEGAGFWGALRLEPGKPERRQQQLLQKQNSTEIRAPSPKGFSGNTARLGKAESRDL